MSKKKQKGISIRVLIPMVAVVLLLGCAIGGTIAWLTAQTDPVVNTFTVGDIDIELFEHEYNQETNSLNKDKKVTGNAYKIVPGRTMPKDPQLIVKAGSEPCWIFLKVQKSNFIDGLSCTPMTGSWTSLDLSNIDDDLAELCDESGIIIYYREFSSNDDFKDTDKTLYVLSGTTKAITVSGNITKEQLNAISGDVSWNFTAYAIQHDGFSDVQSAWEELNKTYNIVPTTPAE